MSEQAEKLAKYKAAAEAQLAECGESSIDDAVLTELVNNLRLVIDNKDALHGKNFVVKKLGEDDQEKGAAAVAAVAEKMSSVRMKNRAAFYYLLKKALT